MDYDKARLFSRILTMHFIEQRNQSDISKLLGLSTAKVNRIIRQARDEGYLEISIKTPYQSLFELEKALTDASGIPEALVSPTYSDDPDTVARTVGGAAADYLLQHLRDGDVLCISGGKQITEIVHALNPQRHYDVTVVPATGGVQGKHYTDVNHLAMELAERLGGRALQLHAPLFADSAAERNMLMDMRQTREVLDKARHADIALLGIGSIVPQDSSYFDLRSMSRADRDALIKEGATGDLFAHLFDVEGQLVGHQHNEKLVALTLAELRDIPLSVGVAASASKVNPIVGALRGRFFKTLISDEVTTKAVLKRLEKGA
ncbi:sugar-binding transcriptional regulator [Saccharospirillum sp. MSK14-1]|uniref:sugar-binding transcriptional regulator n=1 Tax=Saccharospirillum sp. MSK14-1 TaxID=1897632 RepID=UPI001E3653C4|nr:sugar-binding transcriptional regulator [Saccharospirillum sp. MSK14-1]